MIARGGAQALLLSALLGAWAPPAVAAGPPDPALLDSLRGAQVTGVYLLNPEVRSSRPVSVSGHFVGRKVVAKARVQRAWRLELTALLAADSTWGSDCRCAICTGCAVGTRWLGVSLSQGGKDLRVVFALDTREIELHDDGGLKASGKYGSVAEAVRRLVARAFPADPVLRQHNVYGALRAGRCKPDTARLAIERRPVDRVPAVVKRADAPYPDQARATGVEGVVMVAALVGCDGRVVHTRIVKSVPALDATAMETVRQWRFVPAIREGRPVAAWVTVPLRWKF